jgi:hypothetical protein
VGFVGFSVGFFSVGFFSVGFFFLSVGFLGFVPCGFRGLFWGLFSFVGFFLWAFCGFVLRGHSLVGSSLVEFFSLFLVALFLVGFSRWLLLSVGFPTFMASLVLVFFVGVGSFFCGFSLWAFSSAGLFCGVSFSCGRGLSLAGTLLGGVYLWVLGLVAFAIFSRGHSFWKFSLWWGFFCGHLVGSHLWAIFCGFSVGCGLSLADHLLDR